MRSSFAIAIVAVLAPVVSWAGSPPVGPINAKKQAVGAGGMGQVYKGLDQQGRPFAIKFNTHDSQTHVEAAVQSRLNGYAGWPQYHGTFNFNGAFENHPATVSDWVEGVSLHGFHPRDQGQAVRIVRQVLTHLAELHRRGFTHNDVKTNNVQIDPTRGSPSAMLLDFGITTSMRQVSNARAGTAENMAPEQWTAGRRTPATDVFGAAGILAELLTGERPFPAARPIYKAGATPDATTMHQLYRQPETLSKVSDVALRAVLARALNEDPRARFQSAAELSAALAPFAR